MDCGRRVLRTPGTHCASAQVQRAVSGAETPHDSKAHSARWPSSHGRDSRIPVLLDCTLMLPSDQKLTKLRDKAKWVGTRLRESGATAEYLWASCVARIERDALPDEIAEKARRSGTPITTLTELRQLFKALRAGHPVNALNVLFAPSRIEAFTPIEMS